MQVVSARRLIIGRLARFCCGGITLALALVMPAIASASWNGDGKTDVMAADSAGNLYAFHGNGLGGWLTGNGVWIGNGWNQAPSIVQPGDWDGDGKHDVIAVRRDANLYLFRGNGSGGWISGSGELIGSQWDMYHRILAPGDWDSDGHRDLLAVRLDGQLYLYRGNGAGGFINNHGTWIGNGFNTTLSLVGPGDWDGDGYLDLVGVKSDGKLYLYRGNGSGGFITGSGEEIGDGWFFQQIAAPGDFSGDGLPDLLAVQSDGNMYMYRGNGTGGFLSGNPERVGNGWNTWRVLSNPPASSQLYAGYDAAAADPGVRPQVTAHAADLRDASIVTSYRQPQETLSLSGASCYRNGWVRRTARTLLGAVAWRFRMNINFCASNGEITSTNVSIEWEDANSFSYVRGVIERPSPLWKWFDGNPRGGRQFFRKGMVENCVFRYGCISVKYPWIRTTLRANGSFVYQTGG